MTFAGIASTVLQALYVLTVISLVFIIILEKRNPQKTVSWVMVLLFLPVVGVAMYVIFGENHRRLHKMNKRMNRGLQGKQRPDFSHPASEPKDENRKLETLLERVCDAPLIGGNKIDFFDDGKKRFERFFDDLENAKHHIHLLYYTLADDRLGERLRNLLVKKAKAGVEVRVIYDGVGSIKTRRRFFREMSQGGVEVAEFLPVRFWRFARRVNYRNHRKIAVIDGKVGYVGGRNIADCYENGLSWGGWRDLDIRIEGEGIYGLQTTFLTDWFYSMKQKIDSEQYFPKMKPQGGNTLQMVSSGPNDFYENIASGIFEALCSSKKCAFIQTPYFIPNEQTIRAMGVAAMSGVDVRLALSQRSDSRMVNAAGFSFIEELLESGVKVYLYRPGFLHAKSIVIDDNLFITGSANIDIRSFELNFETCAFVYGEECAQRAYGVFMDTIKDSKRLEINEWRKRPRFERVYESFMRIISPVF